MNCVGQRPLSAPEFLGPVLISFVFGGKDESLTLFNVEFLSPIFISSPFVVIDMV